MEGRDLFGQHWFRSGVNPVHYVYCVPGADLVQWRRDGTLGVWSLNRKRDYNRVREIAQYQDRRGHVNGTIHFAELEEEGIVCYEGNHRFWAVSDKIEWVMIDVIWNASEDQVYEEFNAINCAIPVPKIQKKKLDKSGVILRQKIEEYAISLCEAHPKLSGGKGKKPGFTRTDLIDHITEQSKHFCVHGKYTAENLFEAIDYLNFAIGEGIYEVTPGVKGKRSLESANASQFWLYTAKTPLDRQDIAWALTQVAGER